MKIKYGFSLILTILVTGCINRFNLIAPPPAVEEDEVASFKPEQPQEWKLDNGLTVLFLKDDELPQVKGKLFLRGGSLWGPRDNVGAVAALGDQMRQGGAGKRSADQLDFDLEKLSASVSSNFGAEFGSVGFSCLSGDIDEVFKIFADVVLRPKFDSDRLNLWKGLTIDQIKRRREDPSTVATISSVKLLYGDTPYGDVLKTSDVEKISKSGLKKLHDFFVRPNEAILVITGKVEQSYISSLIDSQLSSWKARVDELPPPPTIDLKPKKGVYFIELPFAQSTVQIGQLGVPRLTPDYPDIEVFNEVFGSSGFASRLMKRIRTELGLSYVVYGGISAGLVKGMNYITLQTKSDSTAHAIEESLQVLADMQKEEVPKSDLKERVKAIESSFIFNFESSEAVIGRAAKLRLLRFPNDFDDTYLKKISSVTTSDVMKVARDRWDLGSFVIVVVGNETAYAEVEKMMKNPPPLLSGYELRKVGFTEGLDQPSL